MQVSPLGPAPGRGFLAGARTTSLVVLGLWGVARTAESVFALWVRRAASTTPAE
jgi:hypothetical protein